MMRPGEEPFLGWSHLDQGLRNADRRRRSWKYWRRTRHNREGSSPTAVETRSRPLQPLSTTAPPFVVGQPLEQLAGLDIENATERIQRVHVESLHGTVRVSQAVRCRHGQLGLLRQTVGRPPPLLQVSASRRTMFSMPPVIITTNSY